MATTKKKQTGYKEPKFTSAEMKDLLAHWNDGVVKPKKTTAKKTTKKK